MNRLKLRPEENDPELGPGDYFVVCARFGEWYVSTEMVRVIEDALDAYEPPRWVKFVDLTGARVRLRVLDINYIGQCTAEQRAAERAFNRSMQQERKADRSWDEDED